MARVEYAAQAIKDPPSAVDLDAAIKAKINDCIEANPASRTTKDAKYTSDSQFSYGNICIDSGYATQASSLSQDQTGTEKTEDGVVRGAGFLRRKLRIIDKPIPQAAMDRLANFRILLSKPLKESISRPNPQEFTILWKLKYLGITVSDPSLYLVISCDRHIASKVKRFLEQTHIRQQIGSDLRIHVQPLPATRLNNPDDIAVFNDNVTGFSQTLCGTPLAITWNEQVRTATLGGIVMIHSMDCPDGEIFGITAGHIIPSCLSQVGDLDKKQIHNMEEEMSDDDAFDEDFELDIEFDEAAKREPQSSDQVLKADDIRRRYIYPIGTLIVDSPKDNDWALIKIDPTRWLPNCLPPLSIQAHSEQRQLSCGEEPPLGFKNAAVAICALGRDMTASGLVYGTVSRCESGIMMSSGSRFVEVYDFKPKQSSRLAKGDSGSWVVDEVTGRVYGQVVAVDAFGEGVIIPMLSVLKEIESCPRVIRACLPTAQDVYLAAECQGAADLIAFGAPSEPLSEPHSKTTSTDSGYGSTSNDTSTNADRRDVAIWKSNSKPLDPQRQAYDIAYTWPGVLWKPWDSI